MQTETTTGAHARDEISRTDDGRYTISPQQHAELLQSQRQLWGLVLKITDILHDSSRFTSYPQAAAQEPDDARTQSTVVERSNPDHSRNFSKTLESEALEEDASNKRDIRMTGSTIAATSGPQILNLENMRARRRYAQQQKQSSLLYARASHLTADYDFQCTKCLSPCHTIHGSLWQ